MSDELFDTNADLPGPKLPVSPPPPAGAVSTEDTSAAADGRIHLGFLPPLPALLREWSHPTSDSTCNSSACDKEKVQDDQQQSLTKSPARKGAERTSSGTPIAVAVQSEHGGIGIDIDIAEDEEEMPPPPPPRDQQQQRQQAPFGSQSPLWSMLQSSVAAATTTATSGAAATSNAAAVLPAAALDSPPVKAGLAHLDRAIDAHGPAVAKILTNSMCHLRSSIDHMYAIAAPIPGEEGVELDITENDLMPGVFDDVDDVDVDPAAEDDEDEGFVVLDGELLASFTRSEYDDQDDRFEEELMRKHGRGCISRRGASAVGDQRGGTIRRVRAWMKRRRERCAEAKRERRLSTAGDGDDVCNGDHADDHTVATDVDTHISLDLVCGHPSCPSKSGRYHHIVADGESSDGGGCAPQKTKKRVAKNRTSKIKRNKTKKHRSWGRMRAGTDDSADYLSSSSSDGVCSTKKRKKLQNKKGGKKDVSSKASPSPLESGPTVDTPTAPEAQIIYRGAQVGPNAKPPVTAEARLIGQYDPSGRYLRYDGRDNRLSSSSSLVNRPRLHSSPASFFADASAEKIARYDDLFPDNESGHENKKAMIKTQKPVDELLRSITSAVEEEDKDSDIETEIEMTNATLPQDLIDPAPSIDEGWVLVPSPPSHQTESPAKKSIKVVFLSSPSVSDQKSTLVDRMAGVPPRLSAGIALRDVPISSDLNLSIYDVGAADHGLASLTFTSETVYVIAYDLGAGNAATNIRKCSDACDAEKAIKKANRAFEVDIEENLLAHAYLVARSGVEQCTIIPMILAGERFSRDDEFRRLAIMQKSLESSSSRAGIRFSRRILIDCLGDMDPVKKDIIRAAAMAGDGDASTNKDRLRGVPSSCLDRVRQSVMNQTDQGAKFVPVKKIWDDIGGASSASIEDIKECLRHMASSGSILYFEGRFVGDFVIVDVKFFLSVAAIVARRSETIHHDDTLNNIPSHLPIISSNDAGELWRSVSFISKALADGTVAMSPQDFTNYINEVLVMTATMIPYTTAEGSINYFIPSLCQEAPSDDSWSYKTQESWRTTLACSWRFDASDTVDIMNAVSSALLSHFSSVPENLEVNQVMIWRSSFLVQLSPHHPEAIRSGDAGSVAIFGHLASGSEDFLSVALRSTLPGQRRFVVSARGQSGGGGRNIWEGGYRAVLSALDATFSEFGGVGQSKETICPDCLASHHPSKAATWTNESLGGVILRGESHSLCSNGHQVDTALLCGVSSTGPNNDHATNLRTLNRSASSTSSHLSSVVLVGLYDEHHHTVIRIGSGFIADAKRGLIITAAHVLVNMNSAHSGSKAVIGIIPSSGDASAAVYRYFAELVVEDSGNVDACVLRITTRFEQDVIAIEECANQPEIPVANNTVALLSDLKQLKMTSAREMGEDIRILGYSQGNEGILPRDGHVNRSPDLARGYIARIFRTDTHFNNSSGQFTPREEIVCSCRVIEGMSGGPAMNNEGKVLGLLSRSDKADGERCYLVPASELKKLLRRAKDKCSLTPLEIYWRMNSTT